MSFASPKDPVSPPTRAIPLLSWATRKTQTIWFPVVTLVFIAVLVPTTTAGLVATVQFSLLSRQTVNQELRTRGADMREDVDRWLSGPLLAVQAVNGLPVLKEDIHRLARSEEAGSPTYQRSKDDIDRFFSYHLEGKSFLRGFALLAPGGRILHQHPAGAFDRVTALNPPPDLGPDARILTVEEDTRSALVALQRVDRKGVPGTTVVAALLDLAPLRSLLEKDPDAPRAYLVTSSGKPVLVGREGEVAPRGPGFLGALRGTDQVSDFIGVSGTPVVGIALPLRSAVPWKLVLETPREKALGAVDRFRTKMIWLVLGFTVVLLLPGLLLAKTIVVPLTAMSRTARQIVGESKLGEQVGIRGWGEMKELLEAFNTMSRSLYQSMEALRASNEEFRRLSNTDPLTGRHNRRYMLEALSRDLKQAKRFSQPLSVIMVDIDRFKQFNDKYGHLAGDEALKGISGVLSVNIRDSDVAARWGGEEFLVSLVQTDKPGAINAAEKLRDAVESLTFQFKGKKARLTISCGVATFEEDGRTLEEILEASDQALYLAKEAGRNRVVAFSGPPPAVSTPSSPKRP